MALYIKPSKGCIEFTKLRDFIKNRLLFLHFVRGKSVEEITDGIQQETIAACSECLIEGSTKDRISHFVLRYLCAAYPDMQAFFIQTETELFVYRLHFYEISELQKVMQDAVNQSIEVCKQHYVIKQYKDVLKSLILVSKEFDSARNHKHDLRVPFTAALFFIKERLCPLNSGYVQIPFDRIKNLLVPLFEETIIQGINQITASYCMQKFMDPQIHCMLQEIKVHYILFLKEIGVLYSDVISLFEKEYSIPVTERHNTTNCEHSWDKNGNRYIYSIEHMYGKRGSQKNYNAHSCSTLQDFGTSSCNGGCPFSYIDSSELKETIEPCLIKVQDIEDLSIFSLKKKYTKACQCYFQKKLRYLFDSEMLNNSDVFTHSVNKTNLPDRDLNIPYLEKPEENYMLTNKTYSSKNMYSKNFPCEFSKPSEFFLSLKMLKRSIKS